MVEQVHQMARAIAEHLTRSATDHNEVAKASAYLNQTRDAKAFFTWLDWMAMPRVSEKLARSRQTPEYYRQIQDACQQLRAIQDVDEMAQTLGWAVRLMRYIPHARPIRAQELDALLASKRESAPASHTAERPTTALPTLTMTDLRPGMELIGIVKRTANFGAFVDVGVGRDGLVHISQLKSGYVSSTEEVVKTGQRVTVWVQSVDSATGKIALSMIPPKGGAWPAGPALKPTLTPTSQPAPQPIKQIKTPSAPRPDTVRLSAGAKPESGQWVKGRIAAIEQNRLAVDVGLADTATLMYEHMPGKPDQIEAEDQYEIGQEIEARVRRINQRGRVQLTLLEG